MLIDGYDYHFAYTVGAYCDIADLHLSPAKTLAGECRVITQMAAIMSKAYEDRKRLEDPDHTPRYLTLERLRALSINDIVDQLTPEVNEAVKAGSYVSVEAKPKNAEGAVQA